MKRLALSLVLAVLVGACASAGKNDDTPQLDLQIVGSDLSRDVLYFGGSVAVRFDVEVTNPSGEALKFRTIDLRTVGISSFTLRGGTTPINQAVGPGGTTVVRAPTWGRSEGGNRSVEEPITIRGIAVFERADKSVFQKVFTSTLASRY